MTAIKILAFAGSTRKESFNKKLLRIAVSGAEAAGATVTLVDLKDYPMPLYDGDLEASSGLPENAQKLKTLLEASDGLLIASPEYNGGYTGVLKNTIDWMSRPKPSAFQGKYAALMAASPGAFGGIRSLLHLREVLQKISVTVLADMPTVGLAGDAFDGDKLKDEKKSASVEKVGAQLAEVLQKVKG